MDLQTIVMLLVLGFSIDIQGEVISFNESGLKRIFENLIHEKMEVLRKEKDQKINKLETEMKLLMAERDKKINQLEIMLNNHINVHERDMKEKEMKLQTKVLALSQHEIDQRYTTMQQEMDQQFELVKLKNAVTSKHHQQISKEGHATNGTSLDKDQQTTEEDRNMDGEDFRNDKAFEPVVSDAHGQDSTHLTTEGTESRISRNSTKKRVSPPSSVRAFHVSMSSPVTPTTNTPLIYDQEHLDSGNGYNPKEGIYVVPESGVYVLTWTTLTHQVYVQTFLIINGDTRGSSFSDSRLGTELHTSTGTVVTPLNAGDHVFIRVSSSHTSGGYVYSDTDTERPSFSGWRLN